MLKILNKYKKWIIMFSFVYIYLVFILISPSGYQAITPGEISNTNEIYTIEGKEFENNINTVAVYSWHEITNFQKWITENNSKYIVEELSDYESSLTSSEIKLQGRISNDSSHLNAIITAYKYAKLKDSSIKFDYFLDGLTIYATNNVNLKIGDVITNINNTSITNNSYEDFLRNENLYNEASPSIIKPNQTVRLTILRNDEVLEINLLEKEVIQFYPKYHYNNETISPKIQVQPEKNVGGPSGGMIQTLSIYTALLNIKLTNKIAGTGTIETDNESSVGKIGGLVQKFHTVSKQKVDVFIVPKSQYDLIKDLDNSKTKFKVLQVEAFSDLVSMLESGELKWLKSFHIF